MHVTPLGNTGEGGQPNALHPHPLRLPFVTSWYLSLGEMAYPVQIVVPKSFESALLLMNLGFRYRPTSGHASARSFCLHLGNPLGASPRACEMLCAPTCLVLFPMLIPDLMP